MTNRPTQKRNTSTRSKTTANRSKSSTTGTRRSTSGTRSTGNRPRKPRNNSSYLYTGVALTAAALILLVSIVACSIGGDNDRDNDRDRDRNESSEINSSSSSESSGTSSESSWSSDESSDIPDSSTPDIPVVKPPASGSIEATRAYEEYIGVEYAIDMTEYEKYVCPENEEDFVYLVNPDNPLSANFIPENLVWCTSIREGRPTDWSYMDETANYALEAFLAEAAYYGFDDITVTNAYRSYNSQSSLFNGYVDGDLKSDYVCDECNKYIDYSYYPDKVENRCNDCNSVLVKSGSAYHCEICMIDVGSDNRYVACTDCGAAVRRPTRTETEAHVLTYSTRPGTSEHQSGLCCDMHNLPATTSAFDNTPEALWLAQNAHRFGFILRYPPNTQHITGIKYESWHFRFVGRTAATEIYEMQEKLGLDRMYTLDEYIKNK